MTEPHLSPSGRWSALDLLRGVAVVLMVQQHLGFWLWDMDGRDAALFDMMAAHPLFVGLNSAGGLAAPLFIALAGCGAALLQARQPVHSGRLLALRGTAILGLGFLLDLAAPHWFAPGSWYVLHLIGWSLLTSPLLGRLGTGWLLGLALGMVVAAFLLQNALDTPLAINNDRMNDLSLPGGFVRLALVEGHFPLFPWWAFFLVGLVAGRWLLAGQLRHLLYLGATCLALGLVLVVLPLAWPALAQLPALQRLFQHSTRLYPVFPLLTLGLLSLTLLLTALTMRLAHRIPSVLAGPLVALGRSSLTCLFVHVVLFRELSRPLHLWKALSVPQTAAVMVATLAVFAVLARQWQKVQFRYGAEWAVRKLADGVMR